MNIELRILRPHGSLACATVLSVLVGAVLVDVSSADIVPIGNPQEFNNQRFGYRYHHMPDFDQVRQTLPGGGWSHCGPTSGLNVLTYIAHHFDPNVLSRNGFKMPPGFEPNHDNWDIWETMHYANATQNISTMATHMGWNNGVWPRQAYRGMHTALAGANVSISGSTAVGMFAPNFAWSGPTVARGNLVIFMYGYYLPIGIDPFGIPILFAPNGGHVVTLSGVKRDGAKMYVWARDPADDIADPATSQSKFNHRKFKVENGWVWIVNERLAPHVLQPPHLRYVSRLSPANVLGMPNAWALLTTVVAALPQQGIVVPDDQCPAGAGAGAGQLLILEPQGWSGRTEQIFDSPSGTLILAAAANPEGHTVFLLTAGDDEQPATVWELYPQFAEGQFFIRAKIDGASRMIVGRNRTMFVLAGDELHRIRINIPDEAPPEIDELPYEDAEVENLDPIVVNLPVPAQQLDFDAANDAVVLLSVPDRAILRYDEAVENDPVVLDLPKDLPEAESGDLAVDPTDGTIWIVLNSSDFVFGLQEQDGELSLSETIDIQEIQSPTAISAGDDGRLFVTASGQVVEIQRAGALGGGWDVVDDPFFGGVCVGDGGSIAVPRSPQSFHPVFDSPDEDPWVHPEPPINDGLPEPRCFGDIDSDGVVGVPDLLIMLNNWGPVSAESNFLADLNSDFVVNVSDLLLLFDAWGDCP